jgi:2-oxo-4-hydroxy-4-carboxy-5-ureidoimidazoline decarboxylase
VGDTQWLSTLHIMAEPDAVLNALSDDEARAALLSCCGSTRWVERMLAQRPFASTAALLEAADTVWCGLDKADYLEAFSHHPQIGADLAKLRQKFGKSAGWSSQEQAGVQGASEATLIALCDANAEYLARYGFIFIVCATGKSALEMLALLHARLHNAPDTELAIAAREHAKITQLRLDKLRT